MRWQDQDGAAVVGGKMSWQSHFLLGVGVACRDLSGWYMWVATWVRWLERQGVSEGHGFGVLWVLRGSGGGHL